MSPAATKLRLRTFKVPEAFELRLSDRAASLGQSKADLARSYLDELLGDAAPRLDDLAADQLVLRSYYLTPEQDRGLQTLATRLTEPGKHVSKGQLFRAAIARGLGVATRATRPAKPRPAARQQDEPPKGKARQPDIAQMIANVDKALRSPVTKLAVVIFKELGKPKTSVVRKPDLQQQRKKATLREWEQALALLESIGLPRQQVVALRKSHRVELPQAPAARSS